MDKPMQKLPKFSDQMNRLEEILAWFESEDADLDKSLVHFEEGLRLISDMEKQLKSAKNKVEKIKKQF